MNTPDDTPTRSTRSFTWLCHTDRNADLISALTTLRDNFAYSNGTEAEFRAALSYLITITQDGTFSK